MLPEIKSVFCIALATFRALLSGAGHPGPLNMPGAVGAPFLICDTRVHCVVHTGGRGATNRSRRQIGEDRECLAGILRA